ncbi:hypothetical protein BDQ17DRAFT_1424603 [Cyathus striatus]|nr:hypothetical protein BDQ17DRAFT_1424603 [Cyathus striatus]
MEFQWFAFVEPRISGLAAGRCVLALVARSLHLEPSRTPYATQLEDRVRHEALSLNYHPFPVDIGLEIMKGDEQGDMSPIRRGGSSYRMVPLAVLRPFLLCYMQVADSEWLLFAVPQLGFSHLSQMLVLYLHFRIADKEVGSIEAVSIRSTGIKKVAALIRHLHDPALRGNLPTLFTSRISVLYLFFQGSFPSIVHSSGDTGTTRKPKPKSLNILQGFH